MSNRAIAHRLGVSEKAIRKLVGPSKPADSAQLAFVGITTAAAGKSPASRVPSATLTGDDADRATPPAEDRAGDRDLIAAPADGPARAASRRLRAEMAGLVRRSRSRPRAGQLAFMSGIPFAPLTRALF